MKKFNSVLCIILSIIMLFSLIQITAGAATALGEVHARVTQPAPGKKPANVKLIETDLFTVTETTWDGKFNDDGTFKYGEVYSVTYKVTFENHKSVKDYRLIVKEGRLVTLNGNEVKVIYNNQLDKATFRYTFPPLTDEVANEPIKGPTEKKKLTKEFAPSVPDMTFSEEPAVFSELEIIQFNYTPVAAGQVPDLNVVSAHPDIEVTKVTLDGTFNSDGSCIEGDKYKLSVDFKVKGNVNKLLPPVKYGINPIAKLNETEDIYSREKENRKTGYFSLTVQAPRPKTYLDTSKFLSKEHADTFNYKEIPTLAVLKSKTDAYNLNQGKTSDGVMDYSITSVIVDTADNVNNTFMENMLNLKEVWLSPEVDPVSFIQQHAGHGPTYQYLYAWYDYSAKTWDFKLYVPECKLEAIKELFNSNLNNRMRWFETVVYKGNDVYDAYEKKHSGQDVSIQWCTNHKYNMEITTADRVMIEQDCAHTRAFSYSCSICGKPERNINHWFNNDDLIPPGHTNHTTGRMQHNMREKTAKVIKAENFIGMNSEGEYVYQLSCINCGMKVQDASAYKEFEVYPHLNVIDQFGSVAEYNQMVEVEKKQWTTVILPNALKARVGNRDGGGDTMYSFAVKASPVTAKFSSWAENEVNWAKEEGLLDEALLGSDYTWNINRRQFCSLAVKLAEKLLGEEITPAPSGTFTDTDDIYVRKAYAAGITSGTGNGQFSPYVTLSRQQMATFIYRALMYVRDNSGIRYTIYTPQLEKYSDSSAIQDWARTPMGFMNALGLVKGVSDTAIAPNGECTIEQAILVAYRSLFAEEIGWYQMVNNEAENYEFEPYSDYSGDNRTQTSVEYGDRIWVTSVDSVNPAYDGFLKTSYPYFPERTAWVNGEDFKPIKDLSAEDIALYNKNK